MIVRDSAHCPDAGTHVRLRAGAREWVRVLGVRATGDVRYLHESLPLLFVIHALMCV